MIRYDFKQLVKMILKEAASCGWIKINSDYSMTQMFAGNPC